jgi:2-polyprenyl-3-methyl-5-hydroxy-6-metoxy-1,4-benzoquinol methylase
MYKPILVNNKNIRKDYPIISKYFNLSRSENTSIPKKNNVITSKNFIDLITCTVCNKSSIKEMFVVDGFRHVQCQNCSHVYVKNPLKEKILIEKYKSSEVDKAYLQRMETPFIRKYNKLLYSKYLNIFKKNGIRSGKILEIGCGTGEFLKFMKSQKKFDLYATEFIKSSKKIITKIIKKENFYYQIEIYDLKFDNYFDLIALWGVIEHVRNPVKFLKVCNKFLKKKSKIFFLIPNLFSRAYELLGVNTPTINPRAHLNFFTHKSFELMCKKAGFSVIGKYQELPIIDLMYPFIVDKKKEINEILKKDISYYRSYLIQKK